MMTGPGAKYWCRTGLSVAKSPTSETLQLPAVNLCNYFGDLVVLVILIVFYVITNHKVNIESFYFFRD